MKIKYLKFLLPIVLVFTISCADELQESNELSSDLSKNELNQKIIDEFARSKDFSWNNLSTDDLWSATQLSENLVSVAWKMNDNNEKDIDNDIIIDFILKSENISLNNKKEIILDEDLSLDVLLVKIKNKNTLEGLRKMKEVELLEPSYQMYSNDEAIIAANKVKQSPFNYVSIDFALKNKNSTSIPTNISYPSFFTNHNIPNSWQSGLNGKNIKCAVIDGGVYNNDNVFGNSGNINGLNTQSRTFEKLGFYNSLWFLPFTSNDGKYENGFQLPSGHGNDMCHGIGGPLSQRTGTAYNSNLVSIRASWSVWIDPPANNIATAKAFETLADRNDVKIISMSMGSILPYERLTRAIKKCQEKGKLIFCAGGTFYLPGVQQFLTAFTGFTLFPARLNTVNSCTGIKKLSSTANVPVWGTNCFGIADFILEFDETLTNGSSASSSVATCTTAGMAALIWSKQPSLNAQQVLNKMKAAGDYPFGNHPYFGYGRVDMRKYLINEGLISN